MANLQKSLPARNLDSFPTRGTKLMTKTADINLNAHEFYCLLDKNMLEMTSKFGTSAWNRRRETV
jgi:hypothetical protein